MTRNPFFPALLSAFLLASAGPSDWTALAAGPDLQHHDLSVTLEPGSHRLVAEDTVTLPEGWEAPLRFLMHRGLVPASATPGVEVRPEAPPPDMPDLEAYSVVLPQGRTSFAIRYAGAIFHPLEAYGREYARGFRHTRGIISEEGVYLSGGSFWYPQFGDGLLTFRLRVSCPEGWKAVSQGKREGDAGGGGGPSGWDSAEPQEEIFLVAGLFTEYTMPAAGAEAMVFLRRPDEALARRYLEATGRYLAMYSGLIGPYPYPKFALVENFWETGFGMPSFTLLGPRVIRFPFILRSSYPHEILHNWWGNGVYPEYGSGNWTEGLTAYLADHLIKEQEGEGATYRQAALQKYTDYVSGTRDFPLTEFKSRHSSSTEAVGYGKSLMFFHMLRARLSDGVFVQGLRQFYREYLFRSASFDDLERVLEAVSGTDLSPEFEQWVRRAGAPALRVGLSGIRQEEGGYVASVRLEQVQDGASYRLRVPVALTLEGEREALQEVVVMEGRETEAVFRTGKRPLRVDVDPEFDVFRTLDREEIPPALTGAFGAKRALVVLPSSADPGLIEAYGGLAETWRHSGPEEVEVVRDSELDGLPSDRAVAVFGWENRFLDAVGAAAAPHGVRIEGRTVVMGDALIQGEDHSVVLTARNPENPDQALTWVAVQGPRAAPGLGRKLPHYHKYSYLAFEGTEPRNTLKGRWPIRRSPLTVLIPGEDGGLPQAAMGALMPRQALASLPPPFSGEAMRETVGFLADPALEGRGFGSEGLDAAADFIARRFREAGLLPGGDGGGYFQQWEATGGDPERSATLRNVVGFLPGTVPGREGQSVVIGAHYDHLGLGWPDARKGNRGKVHPGANDNASGVAVLIELAGVLAREQALGRSLVFVAFSGEEAGRLGSRRFVQDGKRFPPERCMGMINIDTVGRLGGGRLLVLDSGSAREWQHLFRGAGAAAGVEIATPAEDLDGSDQKSFREAGVPAVQLFSGADPAYHTPEDTADRIDVGGLARVAAVAREAALALAGRDAPLTFLAGTGEGDHELKGPPRTVSLGTIPDFAYSGRGYRLSGVAAGSPAAEAGLREGDVIVEAGSRPIEGLKDLAGVLRELTPGVRVRVIYLRDGVESEVGLTAAER